MSQNLSSREVCFPVISNYNMKIEISEYQLLNNPEYETIIFLIRNKYLIKNKKVLSYVRIIIPKHIYTHEYMQVLIYESKESSIYLHVERIEHYDSIKTCHSCNAAVNGCCVLAAIKKTRKFSYISTFIAP